MKVSSRARLARQTGGHQFQSRSSRKLQPRGSLEQRIAFLGVYSLKLSFEETAEVLRGLMPGIEADTFPPPQVETFRLEEGPLLHRDVAEYKIKTKPILVS